MRFGIMHPKMVTLRAWVGDMRVAHLLYFFQEDRVGQDCQAQLLPILALAPSDHIVNGRKAQLLMVKMPMNHDSSRLSFKPALIPTYPTGGVNSRCAAPDGLHQIPARCPKNQVF